MATALGYSSQSAAINRIEEVRTIAANRLPLEL